MADDLRLARKLDAATRKVHDAAVAAEGSVHQARLLEVTQELSAIADQIDPNRQAFERSQPTK